MYLEGLREDKLYQLIDQFNERKINQRFLFCIILQFASII